MISVAEAQALLLSLVKPLDGETVPLRQAVGRMLMGAVTALDPIPPFSASAMDGYAVARVDVAPGDRFTVVGESAAGHPYAGTISGDQAVRIFTGATLPNGGQRIIIQEDVVRQRDGLVIRPELGDGLHIRPAAGDMAMGDRHVSNDPLGPRDIALIAAMGHGQVAVRRKPRVAILMTGDELRPPGEPLAPGQIRASNGYGIAAELELAGADVRLLPIAQDTAESLSAALGLIGDADLLITIGGASVGDHDLVAPALTQAGMDMAFHKVAMRPGKPLMAGKLGNTAVVGLPGNPVSAMVCTTIFILPMVRKMLGQCSDIPLETRRLVAPLPPNGPRQHYMRAMLIGDDRVEVAERQDSSLLSVLTQSDALVIRPPSDGACVLDQEVSVMPLTR